MLKNDHGSSASYKHYVVASYLFISRQSICLPHPRLDLRSLTANYSILTLSGVQYYGLIRNRLGIEAWARQMITECYPETKDVKMVTNRTRDQRDY